jgi:hypothetical protein
MTEEWIYCSRCLRDIKYRDYEHIGGKHIHHEGLSHYHTGELVDPPDLPEATEEEEEE